ncbi:glycosyltransferase [Patescibacteria group bacterium]
MKVAFVYDRVNKFGGAERVLLALHEIWPKAPLYTAFYDRKNASWSSVFDVRPSIANSIPLAKNNHELFAWITGFSFEQFCFDEYDVVISITSAEAKSIITKHNTLHVCYCLTPTRYLWSGHDEYIDNPSMGISSNMASWGLKRSARLLRKWDMIASSRPDKYIAISNIVKDRIIKYYKRNVDSIIYPPVDLEIFNNQKSKNLTTSDYYLTVSRFVGYKRLDIIIDAFNKLGWPLVVIGSGKNEKTLKNKSASNIKFIDSRLTDSNLVNYYYSCKAFVFAGSEDFGLVAVEAQSLGKPVIAYANSGISDIVIDEVTGLLFKKQNSTSLINALKRSKYLEFDKLKCQKNAARFGKSVFKRSFFDFIEKSYQNKIQK